MSDDLDIPGTGERVALPPLTDLSGLTAELSVLGEPMRPARQLAGGLVVAVGLGLAGREAGAEEVLRFVYQPAQPMDAKLVALAASHGAPEGDASTTQEWSGVTSSPVAARPIERLPQATGVQTAIEYSEASIVVPPTTNRQRVLPVLLARDVEVRSVEAEGAEMVELPPVPARLDGYRLLFASNRTATPLEAVVTTEPVITVPAAVNKVPVRALSLKKVEEPVTTEVSRVAAPVVVPGAPIQAVGVSSANEVTGPSVEVAVVTPPTPVQIATTPADAAITAAPTKDALVVLAPPAPVGMPVGTSPEARLNTSVEQTVAVPVTLPAPQNIPAPVARLEGGGKPPGQLTIPAPETKLSYDRTVPDEVIRKQFIDQLTTQAPITAEEFIRFTKEGINTDYIDSFVGTPGMRAEKFVTHHSVELYDNPADLAEFMRDRGVGVQYYIDRNGKVYQFMRNTDWITAQASGINSTSAGVEIASDCGLPRLCSDFWDPTAPYTPLQVRANALLNVKWLLENGVVPSRNSQNPMAPDSSVVGHADVGDAHGYEGQPDGSPDFMDPFFERMVGPLYIELQKQGLDDPTTWESYQLGTTEIDAEPDQTVEQQEVDSGQTVESEGADSTADTNDEEELPAVLPPQPLPATAKDAVKPSTGSWIITLPPFTRGATLKPVMPYVPPARPASAPEVVPVSGFRESGALPTPEANTEALNPYAAMSVGQLASRILEYRDQDKLVIEQWPDDRLGAAVADLVDNGQTFTVNAQNGDQIPVNRRVLELLLAFADAGLEVQFNSFTDGGHGTYSFHYTGDAADYGITKDITRIYSYLWDNSEALGVGELIWGGMPADGSKPNLRNGTPFEYDSQTMAAHAANHHLHVSFGMLPDDQPLPNSLFRNGKLVLDGSVDELPAVQPEQPSVVPPEAEAEPLLPAPIPATILPSGTAEASTTIASDSAELAPSEPIVTITPATVPSKRLVPLAEAPVVDEGPQTDDTRSNPFVVIARDPERRKKSLIILAPPKPDKPTISDNTKTPGPARVEASPMPKVPELVEKYVNSGIVAQMLPGAPQENVNLYGPLLLEALAEQGIADDQMILYTFATVRPEWGRFEPIDEFPHPDMKPVCEAAGREYGPGCQYDITIDPELASQLSNDQPGDGVRYHGRGIVQLTGKGNYINYGGVLGVDLVGHPELANDPVIAVRIMAAYMKENESRIRSALDAGNMGRARAVVNGGTRGLDVFTESFEIGQALLG